MPDFTAKYSIDQIVVNNSGQVAKVVSFTIRGNPLTIDYDIQNVTNLVHYLVGEDQLFSSPLEYKQYKEEIIARESNQKRIDLAENIKIITYRFNKAQLNDVVFEGD